MSMTKNKRATRQNKQPTLNNYVESNPGSQNSHTPEKNTDTEETATRNKNMADTSPTAPTRLTVTQQTASSSGTETITTIEETEVTDVTNKEIKLLIANLEKRLSADIKGLNTQLTEQIGQVNTAVNKLSDRIDIIEGDNIELNDRLSKCEEAKSYVESLSDKIKSLENKLEYNEFRDRKYNKLIYGLPETGPTQNENKLFESS